MGLALAAMTALVIASGCSPAASQDAAPSGSVTTVGKHVVDADLGNRVDEFLASSPTDSYRNCRAFLVLVDGQPVVERYYKSTPETTVNIHSVGKSVLSTLVGMAIDDGHLRSLDQTVEELLPAYRPVMAPAVKAVTVRQLLTMTAGLPPDEVFYPQAFRSTQDWVPPILTAGPTQPPGQGFEYSSAGSHLLSAILSAATGRSVLDYAREKLFTPLGISTTPAAEPVVRPESLPEYELAGFAWPVDPAGHHDGGGGQKLTARDMAKLGRLWLDKGQWEGRRLVSAEWVSESTRPQVPTAGRGIAPGYGFQFWVPEGPGHGAFAAAGFGGQLIEVVPELGLVVVVQSSTNPDPTAPADPGIARERGYVELVELMIAPAIR